ncbi:MAG: OB-fold nucleic acid binding domain-containing protein, partial [Pseudomonadota bacterium]
MFSRMSYPRPPSCLTAAELHLPPEKAWVSVAGLVLVRQRPGTAKGVIFVTLEDETGVANIVVWAKIYEKFRRQIIAGRLLRVTGRLQRDGRVVHIVAHLVEDLSHMLDELAIGAPRIDPTGPTDEAKRPVLSRARPRAMHPREQAGRLLRRAES